MKVPIEYMCDGYFGSMEGASVPALRQCLSVYKRLTDSGDIRVDVMLLVLHIIRVGMLEVFTPNEERFIISLAYYRAVMDALEVQPEDDIRPHQKLKDDAYRVGTLYYYQTDMRGDNLFATVMKRYTKKGWNTIRVVSKFLDLHHRAVIRVNHPDRKRSRGEFECGDDEDRV